MRDLPTAFAFSRDEKAAVFDGSFGGINSMTAVSCDDQLHCVESAARLMGVWPAEPSTCTLASAPGSSQLTSVDSRLTASFASNVV